MSEQQPPLDPPPPPGASASARQRFPTWAYAIFGGCAVAIVALVVALVVVLSNGDDKSPTASSDGSPTSSATSSPSQPATMIVSGTMTLTSADIDAYGGECYGTDGYDDTSSGAQIVIRNSSGEAVAVGALDVGNRQSSVECQFGFIVQDVPTGLGIYSIEVSHRGEISFSEDQARGLTLTLG